MRRYATKTQTEHQSLGAVERHRGMSPRAALLLRRGLGLAIALGIAYGIFHVIFRTEVLAPMLAYAEPVKDAVGWVTEDPKRAWGALAAIVIPHIGLYYMLFEDRK